jgi:hypothetical protein
VFSNNLNLGGYLIHPGKLSETAQRALIQALVEKLAGIRNAHRPIVLQEGMKFERAAMVARDAQLEEARVWQIKLIAMRFRIPLYMLGLADRGTDAEQQAQDLVRYTLRPWVRRIEQAVRRDLILVPRLYEAKFNMEALLRGDSKTRADYFSKALGAGGSPAWLTANVVRKVEGWPRSDQPEADRLGVGTNPNSAPPRTGAALADDSPQGRAARVVRKEIAAIRRLCGRHAGDADAFRAAVAAFYGGHASMVASTLGIAKSAARAYCAHVRDEVLTSGDVESLLERWEDGRAAEIARTLREHGS